VIIELIDDNNTLNEKIIKLKTQNTLLIQERNKIQNKYNNLKNILHLWTFHTLGKLLCLGIYII